MNAKTYLAFLRDQAASWIREDAPHVVGFFAYVVEVHATEVTKVRIKRDGEEFADKPFYSTLGPYSPEVDDRVFCVTVQGGVIVMGAMNKEE